MRVRVSCRQEMIRDTKRGGKSEQSSRRGWRGWRWKVSHTFDRSRVLDFPLCISVCVTVSVGIKEGCIKGFQKVI
jgi:hypothetical protein